MLNVDLAGVVLASDCKLNCLFTQGRMPNSTFLIQHSTFLIQHSTFLIQHYLKGPDRYQSGSTCR